MCLCGTAVTSLGPVCLVCAKPKFRGFILELPEWFFSLYSFQSWLVACADVDTAGQLYHGLKDQERNYGIGCRMCR